MPRRLPGRAIQAGTITVTQLETSVATTVQTGGGPKITAVQVTSNSYVVLDDTAVDIAGGYIKITGTGFAAGCQVLINNTPATSTTYIGPTEVRAQLPATAAGTYMLYLINADGGVAIRVNGVTFSATPSWVTASDLTSYALGDAISIQLSATGASTFALAAGSTLPTGLTLSAGGLLSGSVTGLENDTSYSFTITAIDAENQDSPRTFSISITVQLQVSRSLRFNSADQAYLIRTPATAGNRRTWTWSCWIKKTRNGTFDPFFSGWVDTSNRMYLSFSSADKLQSFCRIGGVDQLEILTNAVFRDNSSWYHVVYACDTTLATGTDRLKIWVNGQQQTLAWTTTPAQNTELYINSAVNHYIGQHGGGDYSSYMLAESYFIDGSALTPSSFAETNNTTGQYIPKKYTGTYGTNGFYLPFTDNSSVLNLGRNYQPLTTDPFWPQTVLLLNGTGTNNAQNNTFTDSSTNAFAITRNGNTTQGRFSPFTQGGWSNYFDGTNDNLMVADATALDLGLGNFTIECWIYLAGGSGTFRQFFSKYTGGVGIEWYVSNANKLEVYFNGGAGQITSTGTINTNTWYHVALVRSGTGAAQTKFYINGSEDGSNQVNLNLDNAGALYIGESGAASNDYLGYICDMRVIKGTAVYTGNFTPPIAPIRTSGAASAASYPSTTNVNTSFAESATSLLTCQSNRFIDNSTNNFAITRNGDTRVVAFSPFTPTTAYSAATHGGSAYFDGSGDYLTAASNAAFAFGTGEFTYETWFYCKGANSSDQLFYDLGSANTAGSFSVFTSLSVLTVRIGGLGNDLTYNLTSSWPNQWHHLAIVRNSSNVLTIYLDGTSIASGTRAQDVTQSSPYIGVGAGVLAGYNYSGYFSNTRVVKGTAVYTGTFTPPSLAPLTNTGSTSAAAYPSTTNVNTGFAISATSLLLNFVNAGIVDATGDNNIETVGDAKISTAQSKWAGSSMLFDGTGDNLFIGSGARNFSLGTSDFTIECWFRHNGAQNSDSAIFSFSNANFFVCHNNATSYNNLITVWIDPYSAGLRALTGTTTLVDATWYHLAISRAGGVWRLFLNGVQEATYTNSADPLPAGAYLTIGSRQTGNYYYKGYIQDFRITLAARYTGTFTPPTAQFAYNQGDINYNQWVPTNFSVTAGAGNDSLLDVPTNWGVDTGLGGEVRGSYATLNPLDKTSLVTLSDGNLVGTKTTASLSGTTRATFGVSSGKWYWEFTQTATAGANNEAVGVANGAASLSQYIGENSNSWSYWNAGVKYYNGASASYGASYTNGDTIGCALDMDVGTITFYKNGVSQGQAYSGITGTIFPAFTCFQTSGAFVFNAGQRPFAYAAPSGFKSLNTHNLPALAVTKSNTAFDTVLYTGTGTARTITGFNFSPDLVWVKQRSGAATAHSLQDIVRGADKHLTSNGTDVEANSAAYGGGVTAFTGNGFSTGTWGAVNENTQTYVAWAWDAGTTTVVNTAGTIQSNVRVNTTAGFSIVTYTGNSTAGATVGHGLGAAPSMIILKSRTSAGGWAVYHTSLGPTQYIWLMQTSSAATYSGAWNNTAPTSSVFTLGNDGQWNGAYNFVAYCWAAVPGFSAFGSYVGNGAADGPFVYTGFRSRFLLIKQSSGGTIGAGQSDWLIYDTARGSFNLVTADKALSPNRTDAEAWLSAASTESVDILSNGFKLRGGPTNLTNNTSVNYIYAAFAESPFKYARAR